MAFLRTVLLVLLLAKSSGKRRCDYREILGSYTEIIYVELQNLNLSGSSNSFKRDPCPSTKADRILISIYRLSQQIQCQSTEKDSDLKRPVERMEQLIAQYCQPEFLRKRFSCSAVQKIQRKKKRRIRLIKVINALINCWQKLTSLLTQSEYK